MTYSCDNIDAFKTSLLAFIDKNRRVSVAQISFHYSVSPLFVRRVVDDLLAAGAIEEVGYEFGAKEVACES